MYLLIPDTSDQLFNLEVEPAVAVTTQTWHLRGTAEIVKEQTDLFLAKQCQWHTLVKVTPIRLHILAGSGAENYIETIDFDPESSA